MFHPMQVVEEIVNKGGAYRHISTFLYQGILLRKMYWKKSA